MAAFHALVSSVIGPLAEQFRCLALPSARDRVLLARFQQESRLEIYLQPGGLNTVEPLEAGNTPLRYGLGDLQFEFLPVDFTQVNAAINVRLIERALEYLKPAADDRVLDLFCGLGNFSLPVAQRVAQVQG
ncbi:MAG: 23S rRNA (uracil(1939)-C(5))-methyltransferase, partial [Poseidonia sp.]